MSAVVEESFREAEADSNRRSVLSEEVLGKHGNVLQIVAPTAVRRSLEASATTRGKRSLHQRRCDMLSIFFRVFRCETFIMCSFERVSSA